MKATWIIQYKFEHIGVNERAEALGADVRALPLFDNTFDVATCNHSLLEIQGNTQMLRETYRVLRPGGHFIISGICRFPRILPNGRPALPQGLTLEEYRRFAEAADLHHIDLDHFQSRVQTAGFEQVWVKTLMEEYNTRRSIEKFVMILRKGNTDTG